MKTITQTDNGTAANTAMPLINDSQLVVDSERTTKTDLAFLVYDAEVEPIKTAPPITDEAYYVSNIKTAWNKAFESVLEVGRLLNGAAEILQPKRFSHDFVKKLPFSYSVARRLMKLAKSPRINDPKYRRLFPVSWNTLNEIMNLPEEAFQLALKNRQINPGCQWKDISRIRREYDLAKDDPDAQAKQPKANANPEVTERPLAPKPIYLWISADVQAVHRDELACLIEDLNRQLPQRYAFISEVQMGVPK